MKILTWNINGVRASKIPLKELFGSLDADVICLQETKVTRDQLDEKSAIVEGYNSYFSFSKARSGYSGVATYVRDEATPVKAEEGLSGQIAASDLDSNIGYYGDQTDFTEEELQALDNEGRTIITQHSIITSEGEKSLVIINVYCPRADPEREERKTYKMRFYKLLQTRAEAILASGSHVIILGDVNTAHRKIDHCDPAEDKEFLTHPGRQWLDHFLWAPYAWQVASSTENGEKHMSLDSDRNIDPDMPGGKFVDTFRYLNTNQENAFTCWSTVTGARALNYGTRIDYIFVDRKLCEASLSESIIMPDLQGSDHCPVKTTLSVGMKQAKKCPPLCTKYLPEFTGKQQKLFAFLTKSEKSQNSSQSSNEDQTELPDSQTLKRRSSETLQSVSKKPKLEKSSSGGKQSSLMNFFGKPKQNKNQQSFGNKDSADKESFDLKKEKVTVVYKPAEEEGKKKTQVSGVWKNLLKGPAPAPLCKGHKEPCVLRTVKKDGLNKGRQFYVCTKPEGPKSNPDSRCDHFEWVEKKKKGSQT